MACVVGNTAKNPRPLAAILPFKVVTNPGVFRFLSANLMRPISGNLPPRSSTNGSAAVSQLLANTEPHMASSQAQPPEGLRETFVAIYDALDDLKHAAETAGGRIRYDPPSADPLERLRRLLDLPERARW